MAVCGVCGREEMPPCPHQSVIAGTMRCLSCGRMLNGYPPVFKQGPIPANPCRRGYYADMEYPETECYRLGYSQAIVALANVSGALMDAATIPVPEAAQYGNAVRMLSAERDEAVGLLREAEWASVGSCGSAAECFFCGEEQSWGQHRPDCTLRAFLAKHPEAG